MSFYERGPVRIHYEEKGSGIPLLVIAGGGLNSTIAGLAGEQSPYNPLTEFSGEYRVIAADLRNANGGQSTGPLEADRPWDSYTDDHIGLMDHLGIDKFMVHGFCIGGPFIWNLLKRAPNRVVAAVLAQPSGSRPEARDLFYDNNMKGWGPELVKRRPEITMEQVDKFLTRMYRTDPDFVFTVSRDFVKQCQTPVLIMPDDIPAHPYAVAMEAAMLAPKAEVSMFPWKQPKERIPLALRQVHSFLRAHRPDDGLSHGLFRKKYRPHPIRGSRQWLPAAVDRGRRVELEHPEYHRHLSAVPRHEGVRQRVPLRRLRPAQRAAGPILRSARDRPALGFPY